MVETSVTAAETNTLDSEPGIVTQQTSSSLRLPFTPGSAVPIPPQRPAPSSGWLGRRRSNMTQAVSPEITVSTIFYTIVDPEHPYTFKVKHFCTTMQYYPCHRCENRGMPSIRMTTIQRQCNACGANRENSVALTVPAAVAAQSATRTFFHPDRPLTYPPKPPVETAPSYVEPIRPEKPVIHVTPTKAHPEDILSISKEDGHSSQPQAHQQDSSQPQAPPSKAVQDSTYSQQPASPPKPVNSQEAPIVQLYPTSMHSAGPCELKTTTLPGLQVPSDVPVIVSAGYTPIHVFEFIIFVAMFALIMRSFLSSFPMFYVPKISMHIFRASAFFIKS
jgi:hypothetical protein